MSGELRSRPNENTGDGGDSGALLTISSGSAR